VDLFTDDDLRDLVTMRSKYCISLFMPTFKNGVDIQQNPVRFKNLLSEAQEQLIAVGVRSTEAIAMLEPGRRVLANGPFWQHQSDGLAAFISPGLVKVYRLQANLPQKSVVGSRFHLKPLLSLLTGNTKFYVLDLDVSGVRFFLGSRYMISQIESEKIPRGLDETLGFDTQEKATQFSSQPAVVGNNTVTVFGYGRQTDKHKVNIVNYFHRVNDSITDLLQGTNAPLVLTGVEYLHPLYRDANTYPHIVDTGVDASIALLNLQSIHEKVWSIVNPIFQKAQERDTDNYKMLSGEKKPIAANDLKTIVNGAQHGRVSTLFVTNGTSAIWGKYDEGRQDIEVHQKELPGDEDLLDRAAINTLLRGGVVYVVEPENMPDITPIAALLRY
jgi:hypothetical protein